MSETGRRFEDLVSIMARLRGPEGCLWDKEQTNRSLARYLVEEAYEVVDAIERDDTRHLAEELGDVLLQVVFQSEIAAGEGLFDVDDVLAGIITKLVRRHPHIFADIKVECPEDVERNWERIKREERKEKAGKPLSALSGVPAALPALLYSEKLQSRAARDGFDWEEYGQVVEKVREELGEAVEAKETRGDVEHELGDLLFAVVNLARFLDVEPETALRRACARFVERYETMERLAAERGASFPGLSLDEKEKLWQEAKGETGN